MTMFRDTPIADMLENRSEAPAEVYYLERPIGPDLDLQFGDLHLALPSNLDCAVNVRGRAEFCDVSFYQIKQLPILYKPKYEEGEIVIWGQGLWAQLLKLLLRPDTD